MTTMRAFVASAKRTATTISRFLPPDGDWVPIVMYETAAGHTHMIEAPSLGNGVDAARELARFVKQQNAVAVAVVHMAWMVDGIDQEHVDAVIAGERPSAKDDPNRKEMVTIFAFDRDGDREDAYALVTRRDGESPLLSEWNVEGKSSGPFTESFQWAVGALTGEPS